MGTLLLIPRMLMRFDVVVVGCAHQPGFETWYLHQKKKKTRCARWLGLLRRRPRLRLLAQVRFGPCEHGQGSELFSRLESYGSFLIAMPWGWFRSSYFIYVCTLFVKQSLNMEMALIMARV